MINHRNTFRSRTETHCGAAPKYIAEQTRNVLRTNNKENNTINKTIEKGTNAKPISLDEVKEYFKEKKKIELAEHFFDYYTANGWVQGKSRKK